MKQRGSVRLIVAVALCWAALAAGCSESKEAGSDQTGGGPTAPPSDSDAPASGALPDARETHAPIDHREARPYTFTVTRLTVVDPTRVTPATESTDERAERTIEVWLYLPDADAAVPLVVFSHGLAGHPDKFETLHEMWAEAGYAVAAPTFPLTNDHVDNPIAGIADGVNQPADVTVVLDHLLREANDANSDLAGRFDTGRLAAAGLSLGGATTYEIAVNETTRDDRFRAAMVMAGLWLPGDGDDLFVAVGGLPVYLLHGDSDPLIALSVAESAYDALASPRFFLTLTGGGHAGPFEDQGGFEPKIPGMDQVIFDSTIAFWDRYLLGTSDTADEFVATTAVDGLSILTYEE
jgi:dienelactone hydrolase